MSLTRPIPFPYTWAQSGEKNTVPDSGADHFNGKADLLGGFPKQTMIPISQGGQPPWGTDHNGILNRITASLQWFQAGGSAVFDQTFCDKISGYSWGAILQDASNATILWFSLVAGNTFNPANDTQTINGASVDRSNYWRALSIADIENLQGRMTNAEGTIINHTSRLDNYGDAINRIFSQELPKKADLNGNISQDFNGNTLLGKMYVKGGSVEVTGGVFTQYAALATQDQITLVPSWGINQLPNNNNVWQFVSYDKDNPTDLSKVDAFIEFKKENSSYNNKPTVAIYKTLIAPTKGDIAEGYKYDQDEIFEGQVVMLGGENEITLCTDPTQVFGVYSKNPAYILNGLKEGHIPVALIGRVPVLIEGPVTRKDRITPTDHGTARALKDKSEIVIGRPIYDDLNNETRLVECFVTSAL